LATWERGVEKITYGHTFEMAGQEAVRLRGRLGNLGRVKLGTGGGDDSGRYGKRDGVPKLEK